MTIQDWGAIGEVVGGVGVVITLIYLATQIRQNTKHIASASLQAMSERVENRMMAVIINPQFADVYRKARHGEELTELETVQIRHWLSVWVSDLQDGYRQMMLGVIEENVLKGRILVISNLLSWEPLLEQWQVLKYAADPVYIEWLENEIGEMEST
jgi:hypothetical protein